MLNSPYLIYFLYFLNSDVKKDQNNLGTVTVQFLYFKPIMFNNAIICLKVLDLTYKTFLFLDDDGDKDAK